VDLRVALAAAFARVEGAWTAHVHAARASKAGVDRRGLSSGACLTAVLIAGNQVRRLAAIATCMWSNDSC
jgi:hypothetical protein